ncbi:HAAS signaling domain-containing protein [Planctobacterium marinum]|uniref:HAAS signaling domain-containing protein n=1 Tax=Planctobacterium marinum TaxID=1631968 RepID=UPI001E54751B|nr:hypothetical protein [Planctobacterium marinum]MCC2604313.1 hypothetical protein [Planctobacterium marinum]
MNLVQTYLTQVESNLPDSADRDVLAELQSSIEEHLETIAEEKGRDASDEEIAEVLRKLGSPRTVAAKYGKQQYLIGPELFPVWRYSVRIALTLVLILFFINGLLRYVTGTSDLFLTSGWFGGLMELGLIAFALTTLIFAILEYQGKTDYFKEDWDPLKAQGIKQSKSDQQDAVTNVISDVAIFIIWNHWLDFSQDATYTLDSLTIQFHDIFHLMYWPVNILLLCSIALYGWQLFSQLWHKSTVVLALLIDVVGLIILGLLLAHADHTVIVGISESLDPRITEHVGLIFKVSLAVIAAFTVLDLRRHIKIMNSL